MRAPSVAPPPAHPTAHPSTQHLESPPKPCHSLPPPPKAIPRFHTRVHGYVSVGKEWGGAHRRARTLCGTPSRPPHRACVQTAPPLPCTPPQRCWVVGHCTGRPGIAGSIATAGSQAGADPPAASGPLPPARRTAHACRLPQHHPALPLSEAGWVGHCTGSPSIVGSKPPAACCSPTATPLGGLAPARRRPAARHPQLCGP